MDELENLKNGLNKSLEDLKKISLAQDLLKQVIKKLGTGELKTNMDTYKEYKKLREENNIPLTPQEQARMLHIAEQADMKEKEV